MIPNYNSSASHSLTFGNISPNISTFLPLSSGVYGLLKFVSWVPVSRDLSPPDYGRSLSHTAHLPLTQAGHEGDGAYAGFTKQGPAEAPVPGPDLLHKEAAMPQRKPNLAPTDRPHREAAALRRIPDSAPSQLL